MQRLPFVPFTNFSTPHHAARRARLRAEIARLERVLARIARDRGVDRAEIMQRQKLRGRAA